ncbi:hypothetical protein BJ508DRAFT_309566 [Ascobolus immersus RN42]|uniref:Uncharacterized protein n=1 Tax=Ascobolus immersus RN42 TaxID=1160509 RepID=A0A3N4I1U5_ASCIM|nr:hypothetical protein BJ508DRAFT_309566 [Ascobolus immersus RN42]
MSVLLRQMLRRRLLEAESSQSVDIILRSLGQSNRRTTPHDTPSLLDRPFTISEKDYWTVKRILEEELRIDNLHLCYRHTSHKLVVSMTLPSEIHETGVEAAGSALLVMGSEAAILAAGSLDIHSRGWRTKGTARLLVADVEQKEDFVTYVGPDVQIHVLSNKVEDLVYPIFAGEIAYTQQYTKVARKCRNVIMGACGLLVMMFAIMINTDNDEKTIEYQSWDYVEKEGENEMVHSYRESPKVLMWSSDSGWQDGEISVPVSCLYHNLKPDIVASLDKAAIHRLFPSGRLGTMSFAQFGQDHCETLMDMMVGTPRLVTKELLASQKQGGYQHEDGQSTVLERTTSFGSSTASESVGDSSSGSIWLPDYSSKKYKAKRSKLDSTSVAEVLRTPGRVTRSQAALKGKRRIDMATVVRESGR